MTDLEQRDEIITNQREEIRRLQAKIAAVVNLLPMLDGHYVTTAEPPMEFLKSDIKRQLEQILYPKGQQ